MHQSKIQGNHIQSHMPIARSRFWKVFALVILLAIISSSVLVFNRWRQPPPISASIPSSLMLIFAQEPILGQTQIYSISGRDAALRWKHAFDLASPYSIVQGEIAYVAGYDQKNHMNHIFALHTNDGSILWKTNAPDWGQSESQPVIADGVIFLKIFRSYCPSIFGLGCSTSSARTMDAFWASDGSRYWEYAIDFAEHNTNVPPGIANYSKH